jgi:pyroglutamyl-peptidase
MLGEARGATTVRLETTAWNELNFTLPDVAGWQPRGGAIVAGAPRSLAATLPMEIFQADLSAAGFPVACSTEPGRYLCNQLMFCTLSHLAKHSPSTAAGFIHLPLSSELETSRAIDAIGLVIQGILTRSRSVDFPVGTRPPRR